MVKLPSAEGRVPPNELLETSKLKRLVSWPTLVGMDPEKEFWKRFREYKFVREPMKLKGPDKRFLLKSSSSKEVNSEREEGIVEE